MKKLGICTFYMLSVFALKAQEVSMQEVDYIQSMYGVEKKQLVTEFLNLDDEIATVFWPIYEEYEIERKELGKSRIELLQYFQKNNDEMTDEKADYWMKEMIKLGGKTDKLLKSYYGKVKKASNAIVAARFVQIESYLLTAQRFAIQDALPVVGGQLK